MNKEWRNIHSLFFNHLIKRFKFNYIYKKLKIIFLYKSGIYPVNELLKYKPRTSLYKLGSCLKT